MTLRNAILGLALIVASGAGGFAFGLKTAPIPARHAKLSEFKVHLKNLEQANPSPQLREYLKSRLYFLACGMSPRDLKGIFFDFGPVDETLLRGFSGIKGPETEAEIYQQAMTKHGRKAKEPQ